MGGAKHSLMELRQDLHETECVINILERASQELTTIINWDDSVRSDPSRGRQLTSIGEQFAIARTANVAGATDRAAANHGVMTMDSDDCWSIMRSG